MFKEGFSFKKSAWHAKLMKYIWGFGNKEFTHMCPYFWLSVFNIVISPVFLPLKFTFWTLIPRIILFPLWKGFKWICNSLEKYAKKLHDDFERWQLKQEEKWEEERKAGLIRLDRTEIERVKEIPDHIIEDIRTSLGWYTSEYRDEQRIRRGKKWEKWFKIFLDLHRVDPKTWNKIIDAKNVVVEEIKEVEEKLSAPNLLQKASVPLSEKEVQKLMEKEEKRLQRLKYQAAVQDVEEMKKHARELAKREADKKRKELQDKRKIHKADVVRRNKERINRILKIAKPIATVFIWIIGIAAAAIGLFLVYKGVLFLRKFFSSIPHTFWIKTGDISKWVGIIGGIILLFIGLIFGIRWLFINVTLPSIKLPKVRIPLPKIGIRIKNPNFDSYFPQIDISKPIKKFLTKFSDTLWYICKIIWKGLKYTIWPLRQFGKGFITFLKIIKTTYNNNCPPIHWDDDKN